MKWIQTRKEKLQQKTAKSLEEVVQELTGSLFTVAPLIRCSENSKKFPEKCPCKS